MNEMQTEIRGLIVSALMLPEAQAARLGADDNLFETMGLDSVDALEVVMALKRKYGVEFSPDDEHTRVTLSTVGRIASYVQNHQAHHMPEPADDGRARMLAKIQVSFEELFDIQRHRVTEQADLVADLGLDSVDALDMLARLQEVTGKRIPESRVESIRKVGEVVDLCLSFEDEQAA